MKGTVISLGHTVFILSSRHCTSTILWEEGGRKEEKEISGFYFFSVFSVGEDHKLFSERDILFLMQLVWELRVGLMCISDEHSWFHKEEK